MKIAYLILAHNNPEQLRSLCDKLHSEFCDIYIHIDRKSDIDDFLPIFSDINSNVFFIKDRVKVNWMGFSQVQATLNMMKSALSKEDYKYCIFLSGVDYPIKTNDYIYDFLQSNNKEFINFWKLEDRISWMHKIESYYLTDYISIRHWKESFFSRPFNFTFWGAFFSFKKFFRKRKFIDGLTPYGGSSWWMLTSNCCKYILDTVEKKTEIASFYKYTHAPDEMFFQTIIMNSDFRKNVNMYHEYNSWKINVENKKNMLPESEFNFRYIDWSGRKGQYPVILDSNDIPRILESKCLFARKFCTQESSSLIKFIDDNILG